MTTRGFLRTLLKVAALFMLAVLAASVMQFAWAYFRTPRLVSQFEQARPPTLDPAQISKVRREWLLAVDDPTFYRHHGLDSRTPGAGYTTITQGIVKFLFFEGFRPGLLRWRKVQQTVIALAFNARVSKEEQLRLFVNNAYLGNQRGRGVRGFPEASEAYFGKSFAQLSDDEYLGIVAMLVAPGKYSLALHPEQNHERVQRIKRLLARECEPTAVEDVEYAGCAR